MIKYHYSSLWRTQFVLTLSINCFFLRISSLWRTREEGSMKVTDELQTVKTMISLYCRKKHKNKFCLCDECRALESYVEKRLVKCPYQDNKTFCSNCKIHCYNVEMRNRIKKVMKFSGPRIMFYHPIVAINHIKETIKSVKKKKNMK